ncbi:MAG: hypothetical protein KKA84_13950 [Bacteroidetes bacterium]|nr:hypothetical protein [Bacteroidota bacterium]
MSEKIETLCNLKKSAVTERFEEIVKMVNKPNYICKKCARVANEQIMVCKPKKMHKNL